MTSSPPLVPSVTPTYSVDRAMSQGDFFHWLNSNASVCFRETLFGMHSGYLANQIQLHPFILELSKSLAVWNAESQRNLNYPLLMDTELPPFNKKSYESFLNKIYRTSCVYNINFPNPPGSDWINQITYLGEINDLIRNKISCKFIDGPAILAQKMGALATQYGLRSNSSPRNHDDGYYAYHFYVYIPITFDTGTAPAVTYDVAIEIQISTQLKEVMYEILHKFYADERSSVTKDGWKWDIGSSKFKSGYLSHTLHLLEAMIVELRDKT